MKINETKTTKVSLLTIAAYLSLIIAIVLFAYQASIEPEITKTTSSLLLLLTSFFILACLLFSLIKIIHQSFTKTTQPQSHHALLISWVSGLLLFMNIGFLQMTGIGTSILRYQIDLYCLGTSIDVYCSDNDGFFPTTESWCDLLITEADTYADGFSLSTDSVIGESSLALNKNLEGKRDSEIPNDMVILFETNMGKTNTPRDFPLSKRISAEYILNEQQPKEQDRLVYKDRWNQSGSIEAVAFDNHDQPGTHVLLENGLTEWVPLEEIPKLKWTIAGEVNIPPDLEEAIEKYNDPKLQNIKTFSLTTIISISLILTLIVIWKCNIRRYIGIAISMLILSGVAGGFLGGMAQSLYYPANIEAEGVLFGIIFGALAGLSYVTISTYTCQKFNDSSKIIGFVISCAVITGITCSSLVHLCLMIISRTKAPFALAFAIPFGITAGAILGAITAAVIKKSYYKTETKAAELIETIPAGGQ